MDKHLNVPFTPEEAAALRDELNDCEEFDIVRV